jgi:hypothetical protein
MKCPYCQAPVSKISLLTQIGGTRPCETCKRDFVVRYDWLTVVLVVLAGFAITAAGLTFLTSGQPSGEIVLLASGAILTVAAVVGARAEKVQG